MKFINIVRDHAKNIIRGLSLYDYWSKEDENVNFLLSLTYLINIARSFSETLAPVFIAGGIDAVANRTDTTSDSPLELFGYNAGRLTSTQYLLIWGGLLGTSKFLQNINYSLISSIQMHLSRRIVGKKFLKKLHELEIEYISDQFNVNDTTRLVLRTTEYAGTLLTKTIDQLTPLILNMIFAIVILITSEASGGARIVAVYATYTTLANIVLAYLQKSVKAVAINKANRFANVFQEDLEQIESIRAFRHGESHLTYQAKLFTSFTSSLIKNDLYPSIFKLFLISSPYLAVVLGAIRYYGKDSITKDELNDLIIIINYLVIMQNCAETFGKNIFEALEVVEMINTLQLHNNADEKIERINGVSLQGLEERLTANPPVPIIEFINVSFKKNEKNILTDVSFKFYSGKSYALVGSSGSGKSTIMRLISGFCKPTSGSIKIYGEDINTINVDDLRSKLTLSSQHTSLFRSMEYPNSTLPYNVLYGHVPTNNDDRLLKVRENPLGTCLITIDASPVDKQLDLTAPSWILSPSELYFISDFTKPITRDNLVTTDQSQLKSIVGTLNVTPGLLFKIPLSVEEEEKILHLTGYEKPRDDLDDLQDLFKEKSSYASIATLKPDMKKVSGGEQQRIGWARGWRETPIMILDEPTSALDSITENQLISRFNSFVRESRIKANNNHICVLIVSAHRLDTVKECDEILVFKDGKLQCDPAGHERLTDPIFGNALYKRYYETQNTSPQSFKMFKPVLGSAPPAPVPVVVQGLNSHRYSF